jgi:hypothetical protein
MLTKVDRLTIYSVLCFMTFCALVLRSPEEISFIPLIGLAAAITGLFVELNEQSKLT